MIKLGVIGFSDGNGHPYSWGAIFNGYDKEAMSDCGFPVISDYLSKRELPQECINGAQITHVWTQDKQLSEHIATAALIDNVCETIDELMDAVDAVLLARDDWQSHTDIGLALLKSGKPVYIDKPITVYSKELDALLQAQTYSGQIFSCSALRFSHQLRLTDAEKAGLGDVKYIHAMVPKSWEKYAVHLVDPVVGLFAQNDEIELMKRFAHGEIVQVQAQWRSGLLTQFTTFGSHASKLQIDIVGTKSSKTIVWDDAFSAFKAALEVFVYQVKNDIFVDESSHHQKVVSILEKGMVE
jgi:predicted dehydrogenase